MESSTRIQGRPVTEQDLRLIRQLLADHPDWHRTRLSQELCRHWDWINARGSYKDMAARALLRKLQERGLIALPAPVCGANNGFRHRRPVDLAVDQTPIAGRLRELLPVRVEPVVTPEQAQLFRRLMQAHHSIWGMAGRWERTAGIWHGTVMSGRWAVCCSGRRPGGWRAETGSSAGMTRVASGACRASSTTNDFRGGDQRAQPQ